MSKKKKSDFIDFSGLLADYREKWWWFAISVVVCLALGLIYSKMVHPSYEVRANIMLVSDDATTSMAAGLTDMTSLLGGGNANTEDESVILQSHTVLRDVARRLNLNRTHKVKVMPLVWEFHYQDYPVEVTPDVTINLDTLRSTLLFRVKVHADQTADVSVKAKGEKIAKANGVKLPGVVTTPYGDFHVSLTPYYEKGTSVTSRVQVSGYDDAAEDLSDLVSCGRVSKQSAIITMQMLTPDEQYARDVLDTMIDVYNLRGLDIAKAQNGRTGEFLAGRLDELYKDIMAIEDEVTQFKQRQGVTDVTADAQYRFERLGKSEEAYVKEQITLDLYVATQGMVKASANDNSLIPQQGSPAVQAMIGQYNNAALQRVRLAETARPDNVALQQLDAQLEAFRRNILTTLDREVQAQRELVRQYREQYDISNSDLTSLPSQAQGLTDYFRRRKIKEETYLYLTKKQEETSILMANAQPKAEIIDAAYSLNEDLSISKKMILAIALLFGLLIPPVLIYLHKLLRTKFATAEEVQEVVDVPVLGEVCMARGNDPLVVRPGGSGSVAELFRLIRVNLQFVLGNSADKVILLTSTKSGEGKSFVAINMAASMALIGKRTLLIGMDIRKPRLAEYLKISPAHGLTEYLASSGNMDLDSIITHNVGVKGLDVIAAGPIPPNPSEMLSSPEVDDLFKDLRNLYDFIIIDSAPVGMVSDSFLLTRISNATVYVTRANYSHFSDLRFVQQLYDDNRLPRISLVVNGTQTRSGYGYGYGENQK
jgi:capsular exopolysaccharide synthesis family protein